MIMYDIRVPMGCDVTANSPQIKCHDTGVKLRIFTEIVTKISSLRERKTPYSIPEGAVAVLKIAKPDKTYVLQEGAISSGGSIVFKLAPHALTVAGKSMAEVNIFGADGRRVTSGTFVLDVVKECADDCSPESEPHVDILAEYIQEIKDAKEASENAKVVAQGAAKTAAAASESANEAANNAKGSAELAANASATATEAASRASSAAESIPKDVVGTDDMHAYVSESIKQAIIDSWEVPV